MMFLLLACAHRPLVIFPRCDPEVVTFYGSRKDSVSAKGAPLRLSDAPAEPLGDLPPDLTLTIQRVSGGHLVQLHGEGCPSDVAWAVEVDLTVHGTLGEHPVMATRTNTRLWVAHDSWVAVTEEPWASVVDPKLEQITTEAMGLDMAAGDLQLMGPTRGDAPEVRLMWVPDKGRARVVRAWGVEPPP